MAVENTTQTFESLTVSTTSIGVAQTAAARAAAGHNVARIDVDTTAIRFRFDGGDPTSSVGHNAAAGTSFLLHGAQRIGNFRAIRNGGSDAILRITFDYEIPTSPAV